MRKTVSAATAAVVAFATASAAAPALAHPGHDPIVGTLHAIAHELGGLDILLTAVTLGIAVALAARPLLRRMRARADRRRR